MISNFKKGFTLVEVLMAVGILSIAVVLIMALFSRGSWMVAHSRHTTAAMFLAQEKMEEALNVNSILLKDEQSRNFTGRFSSYKYTITVSRYNPSAPGMKLIAVEVSGPGGEKAHVTSLRALSLTSIAAGGYHSMALRDDGTVWAWGNDASGQLGNGRGGDTLVIFTTPIPVCEGATAISGECAHNFTSTLGMSAGSQHSLLVRSDGTVWATGQNAAGQLGDGTKEDRRVPAQVRSCFNCSEQFLVGAKSAAASLSDSFSLALERDGTVRAWGNNQYGQLGNNEASTSRMFPVTVCEGQGSSPGACAVELSGVTAVSAGNHHSLAVKSDGTVWAWGYNGFGRLGTNAPDSELLRSNAGEVCSAAGPTPGQCARFLDHVTAVSAGYDHSLALKDDGTVWAWGNNYFGQLGNSTSGLEGDSRFPVEVCAAAGDLLGTCKGYLRGVVAIAAGGYHSMALKGDGTVWIWGYGEFGQLGNGTFGFETGSSVPTIVCSKGSSVVGTCSAPLRGVTAIAAGYMHALALKSDGTVWGWGNNAYGQLGSGTNSLREPIPVQTVKF